MSNLTISLRPKQLNEVYKCDLIKKYFNNLHEQKIEYANAYLLQGMIGCGKSTIAKIIMKRMMCLHPKENGDTCDSCENCKAIDNETYNRPDMAFVNGAEAAKDDVLTIIQNFCSTGGTFGSPNKVMFIDEAQELSPAAVKTLLNILETPRKKLHFILTSMGNTDNAVKSGTGKEVPLSIVRRCHTFNFKRLSDIDIMYYLKSIIDSQKITIKPEDCSLPEFLDFIGQNCFGSPGVALQMLNQVMTSEIKTKKDLIEMFGIADHTTTHQAVMSILDGKTDKYSFTLLETSQGTALDQLFGLLLKIIADAKTFQVFKKINDDRDFFVQQAAAVSQHPNFTIFEQEIIELEKRAVPWLRKADFIIAICNIINKCKNTLPSGVRVQSESIPDNKPTIVSDIPKRQIKR